MTGWSGKRKGWLDGYRSKPAIPPALPETDQPPIEKPEQKLAEEYSVLWVPIKCPIRSCKSKNVKCYSSAPPIRYHICRACGCRFKSIEQ